MLSMLSKITLSFDTKDLKNFLFFLPSATLSKNLELQSPSFINLTLDFCLKKTSSFSNTSSNSPFLNSSLPLVQEKNSVLVTSHPTLLCPKEYIFFFFLLSLHKTPWCFWRLLVFEISIQNSLFPQPRSCQ